MMVKVVLEWWVPFYFERVRIYFITKSTKSHTFCFKTSSVFPYLRVNARFFACIFIYQQFHLT